MSQPHVLLVDDMQTSTKMMSFMLKRVNYQTTIFNNPVEALQWLQIPANKPDAIVSDLNMPQMSGIELIQRARKIEGLKHIPILMLSAESDKAQVVASLKAGADDYMIKPIKGHDLAQRLTSLMAKEAAAEEAAGVTPVSISIGVFSLKGGVGTTSIAVNLAVALQSMWGKDAVLLDFSAKNSHAAQLLGLKPEASLIKVVGKKLDDVTLSPLFVKHGSGITLLPAPKYAVESAKITPDIVSQTWAYAHEHFAFTIVDAGSDITAASHAALNRCKIILLLLAPDKTSVSAVENALRLFKQLKYGEDHIMPVLNQLWKQAGLSVHDIEKGSNLKIAHTIPNDTLAFVDAVNTGAPLLEANPMAEVSLAIAKIAYIYSNDAFKENMPEKPSVLLKEMQKE